MLSDIGLDALDRVLPYHHLCHECCSDPMPPCELVARRCFFRTNILSGFTLAHHRLLDAGKVLFLDIAWLD